MKKIIAIMLAVLTLLLSGGCKDNVGGENTPPGDSDTTSGAFAETAEAVPAGIVDYAEESNKNGYSLGKTVRMSEDELVFAYGEIDESKTFADDIVIYFEVYNMKENRITAQSEKYAFISAAVSDLRTFNDGFYLHNSETVFVFNKQCELIKEIPMPRKETAAWDRVPYILSADGKRCMYRPHQDWYISNVDGTGEKLIFENHPKIAASEVFFTSDSNRIAYTGQKLPEGEGHGVDCYGYCDMKTGECTCILADNIYAEVLGDNMIIQERAVDRGKIRSSTVTVYNPVTGETNEIKMKFDDCEEYFLWSDSPEYIISIHSIEGEHHATFNIYKNFELVKTVEYDYFEGDIIDSDDGIFYNTEKKLLIIKYTSTKLQRRTVIGISV